MNLKPGDWTYFFSLKVSTCLFAVWSQEADLLLLTPGLCCVWKHNIPTGEKTKRLIKQRTRQKYFWSRGRQSPTSPENQKPPQNCSMINYSNYFQPAGVFFKFSITSWSWDIVADNLSPRWGDYSLNFCACLSAKPQRNLCANRVSRQLVLRLMERFKYGDKWLLDCCKQTIIISAFRLSDKAAGLKYRNCIFAASHWGQGWTLKRVAVLAALLNLEFSLHVVRLVLLHICFCCRNFKP